MTYFRVLCSAAIAPGLIALQVVNQEIAGQGQEEKLVISRLSIPLKKDSKPFCASGTEDGRLVAFQMEHPEGLGKLDIWLSRLENGRWSVPYNAGSQINTGSHEADAKLSADGTVMVFLRSDDFSKSSRVYISRFRDRSWSAGKLLGPPVSLPNTVQFGALLSKDGRRLYFSSNRAGGQGGFDVYYSDRIGSGWDKWEEPVNLGPVINTDGDENDVAVNPDETMIILPLRRKDSLNDSVDLYISRKRNGQWTSFENMGPRINTPGTDTCPWLGYDGRSLYLNSTWDGLVAGKEAATWIFAIRHSKGF